MKRVKRTAAEQAAYLADRKEIARQQRAQNRADRATGLDALSIALEALSETPEEDARWDALDKVTQGRILNYAADRADMLTALRAVAEAEHLHFDRDVLIQIARSTINKVLDRSETGY